MEYGLGDVVELKKPHPCGGNEWEITRVGVDFKIRCLKCGHVVMLPRWQFEKKIRKVLKRADENDEGGID